MDKFQRTLTLKNSILLGLSSMIGAGLFYNISPTSRISSYSSIIGLVFAGTVAFANASSSAQLAKLYPETGGTYLYAKNVLGLYPSLIAGYSFIIGKLISCIAVALTLGNYLYPENPKLISIVFIIFVTVINFFGISKTVSIAKWFTYTILLILLFYTISVISSSNFSFNIPITSGFSLKNLILSASVWFFAFTGYSRLATFGEEIKNPEIIIPKAILIGLGITLLLYVVISIATLGIIQPQIIENSLTPLKVAFDISRFSEFSFLIVIASTIATGSVLLALLPGVSRVMVAMARDQKIPNLFKTIHEKHNSAYVADIFVGIIISVGILSLNVFSAIKLSAAFILLYYSITNFCILRLEKSKRIFSISIAIYGFMLCLILGISLIIYF
tara:strand:- start:1049 stop:2212 length:1164 start_codon:yes stop_codon:yes gene_type:complete